MPSRALVAVYYARNVIPLEWDASAQAWIPGTALLSGLGTPQSVAISGDGLKALVTDSAVLYSLDWNGSVWVPGTHVHLALSGRRVAMSQDGQHALVTVSAGNRIEVLEWNSGTNSWDLLAPIALTQAIFVAIAPDSIHAIATSNTLNTVLPLTWNGITWIPGTPIPIASAGSSCYGVTFTKDSQRALIAASGDGTITELTWNGAVWVPGTPVAVGTDPVCIALNSTDDEALVACYYGQEVATISFSGGVWAKTGSIPVLYFVDPFDVFIAPDDDHAIVSAFGMTYLLPLTRVGGVWVRGADLVVGDGPTGMAVFIEPETVVPTRIEPSYWNAHRTIASQQGDTIVVPQWVRKVVAIPPATVALMDDVGATVTDQFSGEWIRPARLTGCSVGAAGTIVLKY